MVGVLVASCESTFCFDVRGPLKIGTKIHKPIHEDVRQVDIKYEKITTTNLLYKQLTHSIKDCLEIAKCSNKNTVEIPSGLFLYGSNFQNQRGSRAPCHQPHSKMHGSYVKHRKTVKVAKNSSNGSDGHTTSHNDALSPIETKLTCRPQIRDSQRRICSRLNQVQEI